MTGVVKSSRGAIVAFGLAHLSMNYGYVGKYEPDSTGDYVLVKIGSTLGAPDNLTSLGDDLFAVWSFGRAIVFNRTQIVGVAACVSATGRD